MAETASPERSLSMHELGFIDLDGENSSQVISGVCVLSQNVDLATLKDRLRTFIDGHPHYRCRIVPGKHPHWTLDSYFDLSRHCKAVDAPVLPSNSIVSFVAECASKGFSSEHPPWGCTLVKSRGDDSQDEPSTCAIAFSAHHALVDGLEGFELLSHLFDQHPSQSTERLAVAPVSQNDARTSGSSISWDCVKAVSRDLAMRPTQSPLTGASSSRRRTVELNWSRQQFKAARRRYDASFQELVLTVISDGLRRYCEQRGKVCDVRAILPLGRSRESASGTTNNRHDPGLITLPLTAIHFEQSVEKIRLQIEGLRRQQNQQVFTTMLNFLGRLPRTIRVRTAFRWTETSDLLISLIPGPMRIPEFTGVEVESIYALPALAPGHAMAIGVVTLRKTVCVAIHLDSAILNDSASLRENLNQAYHDLIVQ